MNEEDIKEFHDLDKLKNMKKANKFNYIQGKQITDEESGHRIYDIVGSRLPSVTTILGRTKNQQFLKDGWCTIQFNAFIQEKATTQTMKGGNTDELYKNGTLDKSKMLAKLHPDVAEVVWKFNRWHHKVDYKPFKKNKLKKKKGLKIKKGINNYGMKVVKI